MKTSKIIKTGKNSCYIAKEETRDESNEHDDEVVYVAIKDESDEDEATILLWLHNTCPIS